MTDVEIEKLAKKAYPYVANPDNDLATRSYNQLMHDKRDGFHAGYKAAMEASKGGGLVGEKEFPLKRMTKGTGDSNLVVIVEEAVEDVAIGSLVEVPYVNGLKDPVRAVLQVHDNGMPVRANGRFAIVSKFIYD